MMLGVGIAVCALFLILYVLFLASRYLKCANFLYQKVKRKILFNAALRYVLQSTLKLQIAACTVIVYDHYSS